MAPEELILASGSPRRTFLLREAGIRHRVLPAEVTEADSPDKDGGEALVAGNALLKAEWVSARYPEHLVLAADTTVDLDGRIFNKPAGLEEARVMLRTLSGRTHRVHTAIAFLKDGDNFRHVEVVSSRVRFNVLGDSDIENYLESARPLDKAGAYGIQDGGERIVEAYEGSFSNIMGLPMERILALMEQWRILDHFREKAV